MHGICWLCLMTIVFQINPKVFADEELKLSPRRVKIPSDWEWSGRAGKESDTAPTEAPNVTTAAPTGDLMSSCIIRGKELKLNTFNLKASTTKGEKSSGKNERISINRYYAVKRDRFYVRNTGSSMSIRFENNGRSQARARVCKGSEYNLRQIEVFWSLNNNFGAQHALDGQPHALELQLVHFKMTDQGTNLAKEGQTQPNPKIVFSIIFEVQGHDNPAIESISRAAISVAFPTETYRQVHGVLDLKSLFPANLAYYRYDKGKFIGSPCKNDVTFYVFRQVVPISYRQLDRIRSLRKSETTLVDGVFFREQIQVSGITVTASKDTIELVIVDHEYLGKATTVCPELFNYIAAIVLLYMLHPFT